MTSATLPKFKEEEETKEQKQEHKTLNAAFKIRERLPGDRAKGVYGVFWS